VCPDRYLKTKRARARERVFAAKSFSLSLGSLSLVRAYLLERFHPLTHPLKEENERDRRRESDERYKKKERRRSETRAVLFSRISAGTVSRFFRRERARVKVFAGREGHHERWASALAFPLLSVVEFTS
jgi:hypothetical protein